MTELLRPKKGLEGVVFDTTTISKVIPEEKALYYRGYAVHDLATKRSFEEVAYLLLHSELPGAAELQSFSALEKSLRGLPAELLQMLSLFPETAHPMDTLRTAVSFLGTYHNEITQEVDARYHQAVQLLAQIPTIVAARYRVSEGKTAIPPDADLGFSENFFHMCFERIPDAATIKAFDGSLTLYAEHGFNASTFTARSVVSSLSDMYSGVTAAIGSLKGPLHGGANEAVMHMLLKVPSVLAAEKWLDDALAKKEKVMGFGHRLYRFGDSRVATMKMYRDQLAQVTGESKWVEISNALEAKMVAEKKIYPNLDFPAGPTYYMMGFPINLFTPIFVMARITGWSAHIIEQLADNRLVRPLGEYVGEPPRALP